MRVHSHALRSLQHPWAFEKLMATVLRGLMYNSYLVYLDDMFVIGRTFQEHFLNLTPKTQPVPTNT
ncbi:hypothetical protein B7P43_G01913 [Cryptotermes secundus]|uniref:Reverse transcriptase domain-containing protein n=1 Tax=Cryptotermes secundus TaxID=105785 RepID=A0A2J7QLV6_9NEOP|nr:hypothetical protein B7P43_G01913 [Cryptotermes secundus]